MNNLFPGGKPAASVWLPFIFLAVALAVIGVAICRDVILVQEKRLMLQGEDHDRRIARNMERFLRARIERQLPLPEVVMAFQNLLLELTDLSSYAIFLVDRQTDELIAHSSLSKVDLPAAKVFQRIETLKMSSPGEELFVAGMGAGKLALVYTTQIPDIQQPGRMRWTLGVAADLSMLTMAISEMQRRVGLVLALTALAITLTALLAMYVLQRRFKAINELRRRECDRLLQDARTQATHKATLAAIGQTASMLTHEMRNPLAAIRLGLSDVLSRADKLDERDRRRLTLSINDVERLDGLLSDTLDYVRPASFSAQPMHLDELIDHVMEAQEPLLARSRCRVTRIKCPTCPAIRCDAALLSQVVLNLLHNAVAACPENGNVELALSHGDGALVLQIDNDSPPLEADTLAHAFDAFFTTKPRGTGLGLAVARRIVEEHQGSISMENIELGRVRVRFSLPVSPI